MIEEHLLGRDIRDPLVIRAMREVPREAFVPEEMADLAYEDYPLPIGEGQTISQPYIVAYMTEALELSASDRVLEIGTGSGYAAAVLSRIAATVYTVERFALGVVLFRMLAGELPFPGDAGSATWGFAGGS